MQSQNVQDIRFLQIFPELLEAFIEHRIEAAISTPREDSEYDKAMNDFATAWDRLRSSTSEQQREMLYSLEETQRNVTVRENRYCYLQGWQDALRCMKGEQIGQIPVSA